MNLKDIENRYEYGDTPVKLIKHFVGENLQEKNSQIQAVKKKKERAKVGASQRRKISGVINNASNTDKSCQKQKDQTKCKP